MEGERGSEGKGGVASPVYQAYSITLYMYMYM